MKKKFLTILYQMRKYYNSPWNWIGAKWLCHTRFGLCNASAVAIEKTETFFTYEQRNIFWAIIREEAGKQGANFKRETEYWWRRGQLRPRRRTINAAIKRIENSNI